MKPITHSQTKFILLWTLACVWLPVTTTIWHAQIFPPADQRSLPITQFYIVAYLGAFLLLIIALTQWPLLVGRVKRAWLWPVMGIATYVLQNAFYFGSFELSGALGMRSFLGQALYYIHHSLSEALALGITQALLMRYWRFGAWSWFGIVFAVYAGADVFSNLASQIELLLVSPPDWPPSLARELVGVISFWTFFGSITGWILYRRLNSNPVRFVMPAWIGVATAKFWALRPMHNDRVS